MKKEEIKRIIHITGRYPVVEEFVVPNAKFLTGWVRQHSARFHFTTNHKTYFNKIRQNLLLIRFPHIGWVIDSGCARIGNTRNLPMSSMIIHTF